MDSILFFAPGYSLLFLACVLAFKKRRALTLSKSALFITVVLVLSALSLCAMYIEVAGNTILAMTGLYGFVITAVGLMGLMLVVGLTRLNQNIMGELRALYY